MSILLSLLRATHCRSTHHYFALDSLRQVRSRPGRRLRRILLKHHERFLAGATDPDERFGDFHNHCVHVHEGYWGGAPRLAITWYERLREFLAAGRDADAAYAAGVLSHYFTDPLQPLHTQQSEREPQVHRAMEWSIQCCYDDILKIWINNPLRVTFQLGNGEGWLGEAIFKGAKYANRYYDPLIDNYNLHRGTADPAAGLDDASRRAIAELFGLAITGLAAIWERVADEAYRLRGRPLPLIALPGATVLAAMQIPEKTLVRWFYARRERIAIARILNEIKRTGTLVNHIPLECDINQQVLQVRRRELVWQSQDEPSFHHVSVAHGIAAPHRRGEDTGANDASLLDAERCSDPSR